MNRRPPSRRAATRARTARDLDRLRRRDAGGPFWKSLAVLGGVGWPIVLLATGGALLGRLLDSRWGTGIRFTLMLLLAGTATGTFVAYRSLREHVR